MQPLRGLKVVDFGQGVAGPYGAMLLGDFGADVVKVEPLRGDWSRTLGTRIGQTESATFIAVNRNKRSIALDLTKAAGLEAARRLVAGADIVVQSFRPKVMARYGLDYASLAASRPELIYCSVSGFGVEGPAADFPAGDSTMQAWGGLMSIIGDAEGDPIRVGNVVSDMLAGMNAFQGVLLAVLERAGSGRGCEVQVSLLDSLVAFQAPAFAEFLTTGKPPPRTGNNHPLMSPSGLFRTRDSAVVFSVLEHQWPAFCDFFGIAALKQDPRFADNAGRMRNRAELMAVLVPLFASTATDEVLRRLRACDVPCAPVNDYPAVARDEQVRRNGLLGHTEHPDLGQVPQIGNPVRLPGQPPAANPAPLLGQHGAAVLAAIGYAEGEISAMKQAGVLL